ncbi:MAG: AzlC family ABC transporter permease [Trueperaceae bacterium]
MSGSQHLPPDPDGRQTVAESGGASARTTFLEGVRDITPMVLAVTPFGAVAGLAAVGSGLGFHEAVALSALVNAGSSQLAALQLYAQGAPLLVILATTLVVNLRFLMYSMALAPYLHGVPKRWRLAVSHVLVDQTFAFAVRRFGDRPGAGHRVAYFLGLGIPLLLAWNGGTIIGAALGAQVPAGWSLDFAIPLTFLALLLPAIRDRPAAVAAAAGGATAFLGLGLPYNLGLIVAALVGIAAGLLAERRWWRT